MICWGYSVSVRKPQQLIENLPRGEKPIPANIVEQSKRFLEDLRQRNTEFYNDPRGKGALKDLQQTFPHPWLYVAELLQNAIDEHADRVSIVINNDHLIFEHNGKQFSEKDVESLCARGVSSKGAGTVGFMGVGFKACFRSYENVHVSSGPWQFSLRVPSVRRERFGDLQRSWIGAVLPEWDSDLVPPAEGMNCKFVLSGRLPDLGPIDDDLNRLFGEHRTLLALLAWKGVTDLNWDGDTWVLSKSVTELNDDGDSQLLIEALDETGSSLLRWIMFEGHYQPPSPAIKRFLEHRQLDPDPEDRDRVYAEASRPRQVALFVQLDADGTPLPVDRGSAYALLPTDVTLPIGVHIQADWLLVISRQEFMQIEGNEWHESILRQIPRLLGFYLAWLVSGNCTVNFKNGYDGLPGSYSLDREADRWFTSPEFRESITEEINDLAFLPMPSVGDSTIEFRSPSEARTLPKPLAVAFDKPLMRPRLLFGERIISTRILGQRATAFMSDLAVIDEMSPQELDQIWQQGAVREWRDQLDESDRDKRLAQLLGTLAELDSQDAWAAADLLCLPTESGEWTTRAHLKRFPPDWDILGQEPEISSALENFLAAKHEILSWGFERYIAKSQSAALRFVERVSPPKLEEVVTRWWDSLPVDPDSNQVSLILKFTGWVRGKLAQRKSLVKKVLSLEPEGTLRLLPPGNTLLADPYAGPFRKSLFPDLPLVATSYLDEKETTTADWRSFFESLPLAPQGAFKLHLKATRMGSSELRERLRDDYHPPNTRSSYMTKAWRGLTLDSYSYQLLDAHLPNEVEEAIDGHRITEGFVQDFSSWVLESPSMLSDYPSLIVAYIPYFQSCTAEDSVSQPTSWVRTLRDREWIFTKRGEGPYRPCDLLPKDDPVRPDAKVAALPAKLIELLEQAGISFGVSVPEAPAIERLTVHGVLANPETLLKFIREAIAEAGEDEAKRSLLHKVLEHRPLFPLPQGTTPVDGVLRVAGNRLVRSQRGRSTLSDWIVPIEKFASGSPEREVLELAETVHPFPATTTAGQVMDFLSWVWEAEPDAERVRGVMARAYQYLNEDLAGDPSGATRWEPISKQAKVFTTSHRHWVKIEGNEGVFLDDLNHSSLQAVTKDLELATPGHLGAEALEQTATARLLSLNLLSSRFSVEVQPKGPVAMPNHWQQGFDFIQNQLREQLGDSPEEKEDEAPSTKADRTALPLTRWDSINTLVYDKGLQTHSAASRAALWNGTVAVSGEPRDFARELCRILCDHWGLRLRHDLPEILPELAIRLTEIGDESIVAEWTNRTAEGAQSEDKHPSPAAKVDEPRGDDDKSESPNAPFEGTSGATGTSESSQSSGGQTNEFRPKRNRLLSYVAPPGAVNEGEPDTESSGRRSQIDEAGIARVKQHEKSSNREPDVMPHHNEGYDIKSYDKDGKLARYIEVKSLSGNWDVSNVKMTHSQFDHALENDERYWLYVVERAEHDDYRIHRIKNPARQVTYFVYDSGWEGIGEEDQHLP
jgi:hypothetical protein